MMSLGSGIVFGSLIGYGAYRTSANPKDFLFLLGQFWIHILTVSRPSCLMGCVQNIMCLDPGCVLAWVEHMINWCH